MSIHLQSVRRVLQKYGDTSLSLLIITQTTDASNPLDVINTESSPITLLSLQNDYRVREIDGENIKRTDIKLYVDPTGLTVTPTENDKITDGTIKYNIQNVVTHKEAGVVCMYILQLRI